MELVKVENNEIVVAEEYLLDYAKFLALKAKFEIKEDEFKKALEKAMEENNIDNYENDLIRVTRVKPSTRKGFDKKSLQKDLPDVYTKYETASEVKGYLKFEVK